MLNCNDMNEILPFIIIVPPVEKAGIFTSIQVPRTLLVWILLVTMAASEMFLRNVLKIQMLIPFLFPPPPTSHTPLPQLVNPSLNKYSQLPFASLPLGLGLLMFRSCAVPIKREKIWYLRAERQNNRETRADSFTYTYIPCTNIFRQADSAAKSIKHLSSNDCSWVLFNNIGLTTLYQAQTLL